MNRREFTAAGLSSLLLSAAAPAWAARPTKIDFWDIQRKGSNFFSVKPGKLHFIAAREANIGWGRLTYDKWKTASRDFLIGSADKYDGLVETDMTRLDEVLGWADEAGIRIVLAPLTLPGARWRQNNAGKFDNRLWESKDFWPQCAAFWRDLAGRLKGNPAVVAYNIVNEPAPERGTDAKENGAPGDIAPFVDWYQANKGTSRDLFAFYEMVIAAIREVDQDTPIMVDSGWYAHAAAFSGWPSALPDDKVLYAFHMYEPYDFTAGSNFREKKGYAYPGKVPFAGGQVDWNAGVIDAFLAPVYDWAAEKNIPPLRVVAAEFGCMRQNKGCAAYLADVMANLDRHGVHWAFYSFREDEYDGFDYEVGDKPLGWKYWQAVDKGETPERPYKKNAIWDAIQAGLAR